MNYTLISHIIGAVATAGVVGWSWVSLLRKHTHNINVIIKILSWLVVFEIASGSSLFIINNSGVASFCANIGIYLSVVGISMIALIIKNKPAVPPINTISFASTASIAILLFTIAYKII